MDLLNWIPAAAGDTYFVQPGTVHALGAGLALVEVQQFSDITYRLFDYGRDRELHLDQSMDVSHCGCHPGKAMEKGTVIATCKYFTVEKFVWHESLAYHPDGQCFHLLIFTSGHGTIGGEPYRAGECWKVPAGGEPFEMIPTEATGLLRAYPAGV